MSVIALDDTEGWVIRHTGEVVGGEFCTEKRFGKVEVQLHPDTPAFVVEMFEAFRRGQ